MTENVFREIASTTEPPTAVAQYASFVYYDSPSGAEVGVWQGRGRAIAPGGAPTLNREDYTELMFILEGGVTLAEPDGPELSLKAGDAVVVPPGVPYYWLLPEGQWVKKVDVVLDQAKGAPALPYAHLIRMEGASRVLLEFESGGDVMATRPSASRQPRRAERRSRGRPESCWNSRAAAT